MNLLWPETAIPTSTMAAWVVPDGKKYAVLPHRGRSIELTTPSDYEEALSVMVGLHIIQNSTVKLALNSTFKASMRQAITAGSVRSPLSTVISFIGPQGDHG